MTYLLYLNYLLRHKWYVFLECCKYGLFWQGIVHDWSKFSIAEFFPYAERFFGQTPKCPNVKKRFKYAWLHHIHHNPHHWEHWVYDGNPMLMPLKIMQEMVCDWRGAGKAQGHLGDDECKNWYLENKHKIVLHPENRFWVEHELGVILNDNN